MIINRNTFLKKNDNNDIKKTIEMQKELYKQIPQDKDELFKFPINWGVLIKFDLLESKLKPWLGKKTKEYLSEEEPHTIASILKKVSNKCNPYEIIEKIKAVFEEDTEV